jgi:NADPH:quinone reductase-like Zn-dependent oxidoreductase
VNRADLDGLYPRWQFTRLFSGLRAPKIHRVGLDMAGVVEAVGPDADRFQPGDRVFADLFSFGLGAFAEFVCVPQRALSEVPDDMSLEVAATLPHSAVLALQGLRLRNGETIKPGDRVLVAGASGNVGPFVVQIAKSRGAYVTGVARTEKLDFVRSLGADDVLDYTRIDITRGGEQWDWIVDVEARRSLLRNRHALRPNGVYVALGGPTSVIFGGFATTLPIRWATGKRMGILSWWKPFKAEDVEAIKAMVAAGIIEPRIDRRFPLDDVVEALRWVDDGHARGKVLVTVDDASR